jgi:putative oxidoreductase
MKKLMASYAKISQNNSLSLVLFVLRLQMGIAFILHGLPKIQSPFGWMGPEAPVPGILQGLAALAEFCGGLALILGIATPIAALGLIGTMAVAVIFLIKSGLPFVSNGTPSYELALVYFFISILFLVTGSGRYSLDHQIFGKAKV